jgi:hypothetical protein
LTTGRDHASATIPLLNGLPVPVIAERLDRIDPTGRFAIPAFDAPDDPWRVVVAGC